MREREGVAEEIWAYRAKREGDGLRSGSTAPSVARKDTDTSTRLDVMGQPPSADVASPSRPGRRPGTGDSTSETPSRPLTTQERALIEKEKLRQRDMERDRRERDAFLAAQASGSNPLYGQQPALDPLTALLQAQQQQQQQQQNPMYQQQALLMQALALQQAAAAGGSVPSPTLGYGDMGQQNLIMQLGALLLQQQQQLQMLAAGRAAAASPVPSDPTMSPPAAPALDLNALLALGAGMPNPQAGLAALLQQQQGQQSPQASYPLPLLTTTAPSNNGHGDTTGSRSSMSLDPPSPTTASTNNSIMNATQSTGTNASSTTSAPTTTSSRLTPSPQPSSSSNKLERELEFSGAGGSPLIPPATAPLRLPEGLSRGGMGSFMREFNRELGLSPTTPTGASDDGGSRRADAPAGRIRRDDSPASAGTGGPGTPPPAYMSAR